MNFAGSTHIDPYPTSNELFEYYSNGYLDMDFDGTSDQYSSHKLHYSSEYESIVFQNYLLSLNDAGYSTDELNCLSILDYGCANGIFCKFLINELGLNGDSIFGVDFPSDMLDKCRNISGNFFPISHLNTINRSFDLITLWNVIEHIHDPRSVLKSIIGLLNPFGEILIETPMYGLLAKKMNSHWSHFIVTEHINLFSRNSIKYLFNEYDMECISESSFGANIFEKINPGVKAALDQIAKEKDFGATQVLRFRKTK